MSDTTSRRGMDLDTASRRGMEQAPPAALVKTGEFLDSRLGIAKIAKFGLRKAFPDHWSFLLGEIALYSFIILLISGTFLTFWFKPSMQDVVYNGSYTPLTGVHMSEAFASTVNISFDVRGGLLLRQVHHWAAMLFVAAMMIHMLRIFFTGAFRKPREINWLIGTGLLQLGLIEGFTGYSLPDDLLSGTGVRFIEGLILAVPVVGTYIDFFLFGGAFPGDTFIPRIYGIHILLLPGIILALISAHLALIVYHKHTQYPGPGRTQTNVVGYPLLPVYMAKAGGFFFIVFGVTALMGGFLSLNPVWAYGPYTPNQVGAGTQPDWYMGWVEGGLRMMPNWETHIGGYTISWNIFIPGIGLLVLLAVVMAIYPFIEAWVTGDRRDHQILDRPRDKPVRTGFGVAAITAFGLLWIGGGNDIVATHFDLSIYDITWFLRIAIFVLPVIAFLVTKRICLGLQRQDRELVLHGRESGLIVRSADGEYTEIHEPLSAEETFDLTQREVGRVVELGPAVDDDGVEIKQPPLAKLRARASRFYFGDEVARPTRGEIVAAHEHAAHATHPELTAGGGGEELTTQGAEGSDGSDGRSRG